MAAWTGTEQSPRALTVHSTGTTKATKQPDRGLPILRVRPIGAAGGCGVGLASKPRVSPVVRISVAATARCFAFLLYC